MGIRIMYKKISLNIICLAIIAIELLGSGSTLNLLKNNIATAFVHPIATPTNNTKDTLSKFHFKPGIMVLPMTCSTPNDILKSRHMTTNNATTNSLFSNYLKNQMMIFSGTTKNMNASQLKQALNMEICYPSTFPLLKHFFNDNNMHTP